MIPTFGWQFATRCPQAFKQLAPICFSSLLFPSSIPRLDDSPKSTCQKNSQLLRAPERKERCSLGAGSRLCIIIKCMNRYRMGLCLFRGMPLFGKVLVRFLLYQIIRPDKVSNKILRAQILALVHIISLMLASDDANILNNHTYHCSCSTCDALLC